MAGVLLNEEFEELMKNHKPLVLYFHHPLCSTCQKAGPAIEELMQNYEGFHLEKLNLEEHPDIAAQNMVFIVPSLVVLHDGREYHRQSRFIDIPALNGILGQLQDAIELDKQ